MDEFRFFQSESMFFSILTDDLISKENFIRKLFIPTSEKSHQIASRFTALHKTNQPVFREPERIHTIVSCLID